MDVVLEWKESVNKFISNYNDISDVDKRAKELLDNYDKQMIGLKSTKSYEKGINIFLYVTIFMMVVSLLIIFKEIKKYFK